GVPPSKDALENLSMTEKQCLATFPGLTKELENAKSFGNFRYAKLPEDTIGLIQGRIKDGRLYLLAKGVDTEEPGVSHNQHLDFYFRQGIGKFIYPSIDVLFL